jgi:hypothetical protein
MVYDALNSYRDFAGALGSDEHDTSATTYLASGKRSACHDRSRQIDYRERFARSPLTGSQALAGLRNEFFDKPRPCFAIVRHSMPEDFNLIWIWRVLCRPPIFCGIDERLQIFESLAGFDPVGDIALVGQPVEVNDLDARCSLRSEHGFLFRVLPAFIIVVGENYDRSADDVLLAAMRKTVAAAAKTEC